MTNVLSETYVSKSESFNSFSESQKSDVELARPKTLASVDRTDGDAACSPGNGSVPVSQLPALSLIVSK